MSIQELIDIIDKEKQKRDIMHELTPANVALFNKMAGDTFEAVMTGKRRTYILKQMVSKSKHEEKFDEIKKYENTWSVYPSHIVS